MEQVMLLYQLFPDVRGGKRQFKDRVDLKRLVPHVRAKLGPHQLKNQ